MVMYARIAFENSDRASDSINIPKIIFAALLGIISGATMITLYIEIKDDPSKAETVKNGDVYLILLYIWYALFTLV